MKDFLHQNKTGLIVAAVAVVVRWLYVIELSTDPASSVPIVDEKWHWLWAKEILNESFFGEGSWFRAPLYPYFLAFLHFIGGGSIFVAKFLQVIVAGGTAFYIFRLGEHVFGRTTGLIAGLIYAFYGTMLFYEAMFLIPVLFLFFTVWGMYRLIAYQDSESLRTWLFTGLVFGLATISRPNILLVMPLLMLWAMFFTPGGQTLLSKLRKPVLIGIGLAIAIAPVTARNLIVTCEPTLISSQGGINFYLGNNPVASGLAMQMPEVPLNEALSWRQFQPATHAAAERLAGRSLTEAEASAFWTDRTIDFITENPGDFLGLVWRKTIYLMSGFENSDNSDIYFERQKSVLYSLLLWDGPIDFPFGLLFPLAIAGIYVRRRDFRKLLPLYLFILGYIPTIVLFLVTARHRLPLIPFLAILAAAGIVQAVALWRKRNYANLAIAGVLFLGILLIFNRTYYEEGGQNNFQNHFNAGIKQEHLGNLQEAEQEYLAAKRYYAESPALLTNLGHVQFQLGKVQQAAENYETALQYNPDYHRALNNLGQLVESKGLADSALTLYQKAVANFDPNLARQEELAQILTNLANQFHQRDEIDMAARAFDSAMVLAPTTPEVFRQSAAFYARTRNFTVSDSLFRRLLHLTTLSATDYFNWGLSYIQRGQFEDAIFMLRKSLNQNASLFQTHYLLAVAYFESNRPIEDVMQHLNRTLELNPQYQPALELKQQIEQAGLNR